MFHLVASIVFDILSELVLEKFNANIRSYSFISSLNTLRPQRKLVPYLKHFFVSIQVLKYTAKPINYSIPQFFKFVNR